jgi:hypothetical protein
MLRITYLLPGLILLLLLTAGRVAAQAPSNDNFSKSWTMTGTDWTTNGTTYLLATAEVGEPIHAGVRNGRSVWFNWTAPVTGLTRIDTLGSDYNTLLAVYLGTSLTNLTSVAGNDDIVSCVITQSLVQFTATQGTKYQIAVDGTAPCGLTGRGSGPYVVHLQMLPNTNRTAATLISTGAVWKYLDNGSNPGAAWTGPAFNDGGWASGPAELGYGDTADGRPEATTVSYGPDAANKFPTTYFRRAFVVTNAVNCTNLTLRLLVDDGAVVHLNGVEAARYNMATGAVAYTNYAFANAADDGAVYNPTNLNPGLLVNGTNLLAVEVHQANAGSSDLSFDLELLGDYAAVTNPPPTVAAKIPPAGAVVSNLTQVQVSFSREVRNVNAADLLVNSLPAFGLSGSGSNYTFAFAQPASGTISIGWAANHGITDLSGQAFNAAGAEATWSYTLDARTTLIASNGLWQFLKGTAEASAPGDVWRRLGFAATGWSNGLAPFYYGDPYNTVDNPGTLLSDMLSTYTSLYLRRQFVVANAAAATNLYLSATSDDGFIAWINGVEVLRYNMPAGEVAHDGVASSSISEIAGGGAATLVYTLTNAQAYLVSGTNEIAVHAFNQSLGSSDFGFRAELYAYLADGSQLPPGVLLTTPAPGTLFALTNLAVRFTEPVSGVNAADLLVNGVPAASVAGGTSNAAYTFSFPQPAYGEVVITWATNHGLADFDTPPKGFDGTAPGATFRFTLLNPNAPAITAQTPVAGAIISALTQLQVTFSKPVSGVDPADLLLNGVPASAVTGAGGNYLFTFPQPPYGLVAVTWAAAHGIADLEVPPNVFDAFLAGGTWQYALIDQTAPAILSQVPPAGTHVMNLTQVEVVFTEAVGGVQAADLLINGIPATGLSSSGNRHTFTFATPNATSVQLTWAAGHGIADLAAVPNAFVPSAPGNTWAYTTADNVPPTVLSLTPPAGATVRSLTRILVRFSEPVSGVDAGDLRLNGAPAQSVSGAAEGPYTFQFAEPVPGAVAAVWAANHGIRDLAAVPNALAGGSWSYVLNPEASFD